MVHVPALTTFWAEASLWLALGYGGYFLLLRGSSWLAFRRFYLIGVLLASGLMPWVQMPVAGVGPSLDIVVTAITLPAITLRPETASAPLSAVPWYGWLYGLGCLGAMARLLWRLGSLYRIGASASARRPATGYILVPTGGRMSTGSFFRYLFWDETAALSPAEAAMMQAHELGHIRQGHSYDILLAELAGVLFWFHPFLYLLQRDLRHVHEYLADRAALRQGTLSGYRRLLLSEALGVPLPLAHAFSHPPLKKRCLMMTHRSPLMSTLLRASLALSLLTGLAAVTSCEPTASAEVAVMAASGPLEAMPAPLNLAEVRQAIGYPEALVQAGLEGEVLVKVLVDARGRYARHEVLEAPSEAFTEAIAPHLHDLRFTPAQQAAQAVPAWVTIPFRFKLLSTDKLSQEPKPLNFSDIQGKIGYPEALREAGIQGMVVARILVDREGAYAQHEIVKSDDPQLQAAVEPYLAHLRFDPPRDAEGQATQAWVNLPFRFKLLN